MKRSPLPRRKKPMKRTGITSKTSFDRSQSEQPARKPLARNKKQETRKRIAPRSAKKQAELDDPERDRIRQAVYARDRTCQIAVVALDRCFGPMTPHHRRKAGQGGVWSLSNLIAACAHHNDELEADADLASRARARGLVVRRGDPEWDALG